MLNIILCLIYCNDFWYFHINRFNYERVRLCYSSYILIQLYLSEKKTIIQSLSSEYLAYLNNTFFYPILGLFTDD